MGKGSNYLNNNKGVCLQASKKSKERMPLCNYGLGCKNPSCIYRHPGDDSGSAFFQSPEPCMAFLAGICVFDAKGCRKRHPKEDEAIRLREKYSKVRCRFGDECKTEGCLYLHPSDEQQQTTTMMDEETYVWDNQCEYIAPPQSALHRFQQAQQQQQQQQQQSNIINSQQQQQPEENQTSYYNLQRQHAIQQNQFQQQQQYYQSQPQQQYYQSQQQQEYYQSQQQQGQEEGMMQCQSKVRHLPNINAPAFVPGKSSSFLSTKAKEFVPGP